MKSLTHRAKHLLALLLPVTLLLNGCQLFSKEAEPPVYATLPTVPSKYSTEEIAEFNNRLGQGKTNRYENITIRSTPLLKTPETLPKSLFFDSGIQIAYPKEGVKGIYMTVENTASQETFQQMLSFVDDTALNTMVIDFKDDHGQITAKVNSDNAMVNDNSFDLVPLKDRLKTLEAHQVYPIARIVTFKDHLLAESHPEYSFHDPATGTIWADGNGSNFTNPFLKEVWDYNIDVAIEAAKMGFKEIQFDYVRFPERFETVANLLSYDKGTYANYAVEPILDRDGFELEGSERVAAITDFLKYAKERLAPYGVKVGADIFGYTAIAGNSSDVTGIGQNFVKMSEQLDVVSSMIYPSHWGFGFFGIEYPDMNPFDLVDEYMASETIILQHINTGLISRPWLQDFTYRYDWPEAFQVYGPAQVQDQIDALNKHGIHEFLLWNASGEYNHGVDYMPEANAEE